MLLADLADLKHSDSLSIGSIVYLIRKISGHVVETKLTAFSTGNIPEVEVEWVKNYRDKYRLNLKDNTVHAIDATQKHKNEMKLWYEVYEPQRKQLINLCEEHSVKEKKRKKRL